MSFPSNIKYKGEWVIDVVLQSNLLINLVFLNESLNGFLSKNIVHQKNLLSTMVHGKQWFMVHGKQNNCIRRLLAI